jgi:two-component system cell cycle response regulator CpdR
MKSCSILVIDDEPALREILSQVLTGAGHRVVGAGNGKEASKALTTSAFDVVLTDVIMPEKDGMQVISELRKKFPEVRIIAMSGGGHVSRDQYLKIAKGLGAHAVLEKPFANQKLLDTIEALIPSAA